MFGINARMLINQISTLVDPKFMDPMSGLLLLFWLDVPPYDLIQRLNGNFAAAQTSEAKPRPALGSRPNA